MEPLWKNRTLLHLNLVNTKVEPELAQAIELLISRRRLKKVGA